MEILWVATRLWIKKPEQNLSGSIQTWSHFLQLLPSPLLKFRYSIPTFPLSILDWQLMEMSSGGLPQNMYLMLLTLKEKPSKRLSKIMTLKNLLKKIKKEELRKYGARKDLLRMSALSGQIISLPSRILSWMSTAGFMSGLIPKRK